MLRGQTLDAAIFNQARERPFQGPVSVRRFGVAVDLPARGRRLGRGTVNVTVIPDLAMCVARAFVANRAQRLPSPVNQRQPAREILVVIQVLPKVDPVDGTVFGLRGEVPLSMPAGILPLSGARMRYPFRRRPKVIELIVRHQSISHRTSPSDAYRHGRTAASPRSASMVILVALRQGCERDGR